MSNLLKVVTAFNNSVMPEIMRSIINAAPNKPELLVNCEQHLKTAMAWSTSEDCDVKNAYKWFGCNSDQTLVDIFNAVAWQAEEDLQVYLANHVPIRQTAKVEDLLAGDLVATGSYETTDEKGNNVRKSTFEKVCGVVITPDHVSIVTKEHPESPLNYELNEVVVILR